MAEVKNRQAITHLDIMICCKISIVLLIQYRLRSDIVQRNQRDSVKSTSASLERDEEPLCKQPSITRLIHLEENLRGTAPILKMIIKMDSGIFSLILLKTHIILCPFHLYNSPEICWLLWTLFFSIAERSVSCSSYIILQPELLIKQYTNTAPLYYRQAFVMVQLWPQLNLKAILQA